MIRTNSVKRDGDGKVSKHFRVREFASKDGADKVLIDDDLVSLLEDIREAAGGKAITINSGPKVVGVAYRGEKRLNTRAREQDF